RHIFTTFTYEVPAALAGSPPHPGTRVLVPFGRDERIGWVVGAGDGSAPRGLRPLHDVLDADPTVPDDVLRLCRWMAEYYVAPLGVALRAALPAVLSDVSRDYLSMANGSAAPTAEPDSTGLSARQQKLLDALAAA